MRAAKRRLWIVFVTHVPLPHESVRDSHRFPAGATELRSQPHYSAESRWYSAGFGKDAERNRAHVASQVSYWRALGYHVEMMEEMR